MANPEVYAQIDILVQGHQYPVLICRNALSDKTLLQALVPSQQVLLVTNQTVAPLYLGLIQDACAQKQCDTVILPDGEEHKNQHSLDAIYDVLLNKRHHRDTSIVALGGGVIGDLAGFAASTYQRGVRFIQLPTTLLAQVDASVGGKTAINHVLGKNMIGSFYQPQAVVIDVDTLTTLPDREFKAGLAEMIKYALLDGGDFLNQLQLSLKQGLTAKSDQLPQLIEACCRIKARYVMADERESGARALLNLGHTFAHALEAATQYKQWLHGEAVAIGLYCAAVLSEQLTRIERGLVQRIEEMLSQAGLPHKIPATISLSTLRGMMGLDKKIKDRRLRFVLINKPGDCYLDDSVSEDCLHNALITAVEGE